MTVHEKGRGGSQEYLEVWCFDVSSKAAPCWEDCTGVRKMRCSKSTDEKQESFQELDPFHLSKLKHIHLPFLRHCPSPPLPAAVAACGALQCWLTSTSQHVWESLGWGRGRREWQSWGNRKETQEPPACFQLTPMPWKQLPCGMFLTPEVRLSQRQCVLIQPHSPGCDPPGNRKTSLHWSHANRETDCPSMQLLLPALSCSNTSQQAVARGEGTQPWCSSLCWEDRSPGGDCRGKGNL